MKYEAIAGYTYISKAKVKIVLFFKAHDKSGTVFTLTWHAISYDRIRST